MTTNEIKGEFTLDRGKGEDKETFDLLLDVNALCIAEGMTGLKSSEIVGRLGSGDLTLVRSVLWVAMRRHHEEVSVEECGDIMQEQGPNAVAAALILGLNRAFPAPKKGGDATARPTRRPRAKATATA